MTDKPRWINPERVPLRTSVEHGCVRIRSRCMARDLDLGSVQVRQDVKPSSQRGGLNSNHPDSEFKELLAHLWDAVRMP